MSKSLRIYFVSNFMKKSKTSFCLILSFAFFITAFAQKTKIENPSNKKNESCEQTDLIGANVSEMKTLAEGTNSKIETPFVFVARDAKTFEFLKTKIENLPTASTIDFTKTAVIAAFAGTKKSGGYSLAVKKSGENYLLELLTPPQGAIVTQVLTNPFKVTLVPIEEEKTLSLTIPNELKSATNIYKIASSEFQYSGGFAFREKKFSADGTIDVVQAGDLVTLKFNLSGKGAESEMRLIETASGILKDGKIELLRLDAGSFSENPKPPVKVSGSLNENKMSLIFEPLPTDVADGFSFGGKLEAVKN